MKGKAETGMGRHGDAEEEQIIPDIPESPRLPVPASGLPPSSFPPWRTFCAIELPPGVRAQAKAHISRLKNSFPNVRASWTRDDKFHLTLKFLGEIPQERIKSLVTAASRAAGSLLPFKLLIEGAGAFPPSGAPKVLWLGVTDIAGGLTDLHARLEAECEREGFPKDERAFHPHLTLARIREPRDARLLALFHRQTGFPGIESSVSELLIIRSELSNAGSKYSVVSRHVLT